MTGAEGHIISSRGGVVGDGIAGIPAGRMAAISDVLKKSRPI